MKVRAVSLNYRDLLVVKGLDNPKLPFPYIPLTDGAGDVIAVGDNVSRVKVGDRVAGIFMRTWLVGELTEAKAKSALGAGTRGMLVEYVFLDDDGVVNIPDHLSYEEAATLPCAAVTSWHAMIEAGLKRRESVPTLGTGEVSIFALQFSMLTGARVIITSSSDEKAGEGQTTRGRGWHQLQDRVRLGQTIAGTHRRKRSGPCYRSRDDCRYLPRSLKVVSMGGRINLIGVLTGSTGEINPLSIVMKKICVQGMFVAIGRCLNR